MPTENNSSINSISKTNIHKKKKKHSKVMQSNLKFFNSESTLCPLPRGDNRWLLSSCVSVWLCWILYWLRSFFFCFFIFLLPIFQGLLDLNNGCCCFSYRPDNVSRFSHESPMCAPTFSTPSILNPWKLIYGSNVVFSRRQGLTWMDQCRQHALWITMCPWTTSVTQRTWMDKLPNYIIIFAL